MRWFLILPLAACSPGSDKKQGERAGDSAEEPADGEGEDGHTDEAGDSARDTSIVVEPWCPEPASAPGFDDVAATLGLVDTSDEDSRRKEAGAAGMIDLDGDGIDELLVAHRRDGLVLHLWHEGRLSRRVLVEARELVGLVAGDYDGDGDLDLWTGGYQSRMWLLRNDGPDSPAEDGSPRWRFTDVSAESGLLSLITRPQKMDAAFGDFDGDSDLDLYINHAGPPGTMDEHDLDKLLRNRGDGSFEEVSSWISAEARQGIGWSPAWTDLDADGDLDLFVAKADQASAGPSLLLENDGPDGSGGHRLLDRSADCGCTSNFNPMGVSAGDYDNDGAIDLFLTNTRRDQLLRNLGGLSFVDVSAAVGAMDLETDRHMTFGSAFLDYDNDGWLDIFASSGPLSDRPEPGLDDQADRLLRNMEGEGFENIAESLGVDHRGIGRGVSIGMLSDDGFADVLVVNLDGPSKLWQARCTDARALVIDLEGVGANRFGLGARITVETADGLVQTREITTKPGWAGTMHPRAWFGLGQRAVEVVTVRWPDGTVQEVEVDPAVDGRIRVRHPDFDSR